MVGEGLRGNSSPALQVVFYVHTGVLCLIVNKLTLLPPHVSRTARDLYLVFVHELFPILYTVHFRVAIHRLVERLCSHVFGIVEKPVFPTPKTQISYPDACESGLDLRAAVGVVIDVFLDKFGFDVQRHCYSLRGGL